MKPRPVGGHLRPYVSIVLRVRPSTLCPLSCRYPRPYALAANASPPSGSWTVSSNSLVGQDVVHSRKARRFAIPRSPTSCRRCRPQGGQRPCRRQSSGTATLIRFHPPNSVTGVPVERNGLCTSVLAGRARRVALVHTLCVTSGRSRPASRPYSKLGPSIRSSVVRMSFAVLVLPRAPSRARPSSRPGSRWPVAREAVNDSDVTGSVPSPGGHGRQLCSARTFQRLADGARTPNANSRPAGRARVLTAAGGPVRSGPMPCCALQRGRGTSHRPPGRSASVDPFGIRKGLWGCTCRSW